LSFERIKKFILDTLFPISCVICKKENAWFCQNCFEKIEIVSEQVCPYCEKISSTKGAICPKCKLYFSKKNKEIFLDNLLVSAKYKRGRLSKVIHVYKYNFISDLSIPLGKIILKALVKNNIPIPDLIIPIPLHPRRLRWRGFNQAELLADFISLNLTIGLEIPIEKNVLQRKKYTPPQMKIKSYKERVSNMQGAFCLKKEEIKKIKNQNILLIDDVSTTGSTLLECAKILKFFGAKKVFGAVIARQEIS